MFRVLHLSDIHIGDTYKESESIACKVASDILHNGLSNIKCIVVTGDIFEGTAKYSDSLISEAVNFFEVLLSEINSNQYKNTIEKEDIIFVPGNHDLIRTDDIEKRWDKYNKFLKNFYGAIPSFYNTKNYSLLRTYDDYKLAFVGFNSCEIEKKRIFDNNYIQKFKDNLNESILESSGIQKSKVVEILEKEVSSEYNDFGNIPLKQITPLEREVKKLEGYNVVALFHHHFYLFPEIAQEFGDSSLVRNYAEVTQHLKYMNVSIVLHGHKHFDLERPYIMEDYYSSSDNIIDVFAGGSVGTRRTQRHTFGIMDIYDKKDDIKLVHNKFVYNGESLEPIIKKQIPPQKNHGRIVKLLEILKTLNTDVYERYTEIAQKFKVYESCGKVINWICEALTGFTEVYKYLDDDYKNILFLLYAVNYRVLKYKERIESDKTYFKSPLKSWKEFYVEQLDGNENCVSIEEYHELFSKEKLRDIAALCDKILNKYDSRKSSIYMAFTMLGIFFSDLFLVMTEYADNFKESIKYKINIKIEENVFHENVPVPRIEIKSDADRRSVYVQMLCNEATAHKMAVLFVKEFDLAVNKFEDYFKIIGLKIYFILPKIEKANMKNTLDNYNFEAYIPTLLPLLTGDNIYPSKVVFARELIQNSIDAIAVREEKDTEDFSKRISIEIRVDENNKRYFKITDRGTGMDRYKIERYFTSIGRSFYSGEEYQDLNISYKPISNFGIGFLSSFMVCREIDVKTKYYLEESEGLKLHIPNYDGCFFIELEEKADIGTELKLYLDCKITNQKIVDYIRNSMLDIKYDIAIKYLDDENTEASLKVPARIIRERSKCEEFKFFIPLTEEGEVLDIDYEEVITNEYITKYKYGILIKKKSDIEEQKYVILNAGILVGQADMGTLFGDEFYNRSIFENSMYWHDTRNAYDIIYLNFPSNWLQIDVSREKVSGFTDMIMKKYTKKKVLGDQIAKCLYTQIVSFIEHAKAERKNVPLIYLREAIQYAILFSERNKHSDWHKMLANLQFHLTINFVNNGIIYKIEKGSDNIDIKHDKQAEQAYRTFRQKIYSKNTASHTQRFMLKYGGIGIKKFLLMKSQDF